MSTTRLSELPEPQWWYTDDSQAAMNMSFGLPEEKPLFTADQMHAYGLAVWKAAIQHASEAVPTNWCDELLTGKKGIGQPPYHSPDIERLLTGVRAAILALPLPEQGGPQ